MRAAGEAASAEADADGLSDGLSDGDASADEEADGLSTPVDGTDDVAGDAVPALQAASARPASATVAPRRAMLEWVIKVTSALEGPGRIAWSR